MEEATVQQINMVKAHLWHKWDAQPADDFEEENILLITANFEDGRKQTGLVFLTPQYLTLTAPFAVSEEVSIERIMETSWDFLTGVTMLDGVWSVVHKLPWALVSELAVDKLLAITLEVADDFEQDLYGKSAQRDRF